MENWRVLSHTYATYTSRTGQAAYVVPGVGNIKKSDPGLRSNCLSPRRLVTSLHLAALPLCIMMYYRVLGLKLCSSNQ